MPNVILMFKDVVIQEFPLDRMVASIGRAPDNFIVIDNLAVSGYHANILKENNSYIIEDLNSTNGTFINDRRISRKELKNNDMIFIGKHTLLFSDPEKTESADSTHSGGKGLSEGTMFMDISLIAQEQARQQSASAMPLGIASLIAVEGPIEKKEYSLNSRITKIGKTADAEIKLGGFFAPRLAAIVNKDKDGYSISPTADGRKVTVNGKPVESRVVLTHCDVIEVWKVKFQFFFKE